MASVEAIAQGAFKIISLINTIKDGGKQRLQLLNEINSLWMVLKLVEANFESEEDELGEAWLRTICVLSDEDGVFARIFDVLGTLKTRLEAQAGLRQAVQYFRWPFDKKEVEGLVNQLARLKNDLNLALTSTSATVIREIHNDTNIVKHAVSSVEEKALLEWTSTLNFLKQQNDFIKQVRHGTGEWFLKSEAFTTWTSEEESLLWCPGIPGAGKTFLASIAFEHLKQSYHEQNVAVLIAYCGYNEAKSQSIDNLISALIRQFVQFQSVVSKNLKEMHKSHSKSDTFPSLPELTNLLRKEIAKFDRCFIVVDALDEILDEPKRREFLELLVYGKVNIMITSRRLDSIADLFAPETVCDGCEKEGCRVNYHCNQCCSLGFDLCKSCYEKGLRCPGKDHYTFKQFGARTINIEATQSDVRNYVQWRIDRESELLKCIAKKRSLREKITATLVQQSHGMFLLARLHIDALARKRTPGSVQQTLQNLPTELKEIYESAMDRIATTNEDDKKLAMNLLMWTAFSMRPLRADEIEHATSILPSTRDIDTDEVVNASDLTSLCAGLVIIDASNILRLVHFSAQTYLEENRRKWFPSGDLIIARHCLTYLSFKEFENGPCSGPREREDFEARLKQYPLLDYSCTYWGFHASRSEVPSLLTAQALDFLQSKTLLQTAVQILWYSDNPVVSAWDAKTKVDPLHLAAYHGLTDSVTELLRNGSEVNCRDSRGKTPLMYAVTGRHASMVQTLLRHGADLNLTCDRGTSALSRTIALNDTKTAQILLAEPEIDLQALDRSNGNKTPLMLAASLCCSVILATILQKSGIDVNASSGSYGQTALNLAAATGNVQIVRQLLSHPNIDVKKRDKWCTALTYAAAYDDLHVAEALLDHNADPNIPEDLDCGDDTPLMCAVDGGNLYIVRLLLQRGANANVLDKRKFTVIHNAANNGQSRILETLLEMNCGVDINAQATNGRTALHCAASWDNCSIIKTLFENGARTDIHDNADRSPLREARYQNNLDALHILTKYRKQEELRDETNGLVLKNPRSLLSDTDKTSLLAAAKLGLLDIVQSNITYAKKDRAFDINIVDLDRHSALHYAVEKPYLDMLFALVSAENIDLNIRDKCLRTPLHWSALHECYEAASILLSAGGVDVNAQDHWRQTPLSIALHYRNGRLAILLMEHGAWPLPDLMRKNLVQHALCAAAVGGGTVRLCERLVREGGADPAMKTSDGEAPFYLAEYAGNVETARGILRLCEERESGGEEHVSEENARGFNSYTWTRDSSWRASA